MRDFSSWRVTPVASMFCLIIAAAAPAAAQTPAAPSAAPAAPSVAPATAPPASPAPVAPAASPPPAGYAYPPPPPGYAYAYPAPTAYGLTYPTPLRAPESAPYNGGPVPAGYHVEERARRGMLIGGAVVLGVPWVLGLTIASGYDFSNQSGWLVVPALGPWITIAARKKETICSYDSGGGYSSCYDETDNSVRTMLILDGLTQAAGTIMLIYGLASSKKVVTRDFVGSLHFTPAPIGKLGYGGVLSGQF